MKLTITKWLRVSLLKLALGAAVLVSLQGNSQACTIVHYYYPAFAPSIPSSAGGDVIYDYTFQGNSQGGAQCGSFQILLWGDTEESWSVDGVPKGDHGSGDTFNFGTENCCDPTWDQHCHQTRTRVDGQDVYDPSADDPNSNCSYEGGATYWDAISHSYPYCDPPLTHQHFEGHDPITDELLWTVDIDHVENACPYSYYYAAPFCPCPTRAWGWGAVYRVHAWVKKGASVPGGTLPPLPKPPGGGGGGSEENFFLDLDFGGGPGPSLKHGLAATGVTANDFWNYFNESYWVGSGSLSNLKLVDGTTPVPSIGVSVNNAPGGWGNGSTDPMYNNFIYPFYGGNITITLSGLPDDVYDLYLYCSDGKYQVTSSGVDYGTRSSREYPVINPPNWQEGVQYVHFHSVVVATGQPIVIAVLPGLDGLPVISGLQIAPGTPPPSCTPPPGSLVGWWPAENNADDITGGDNGTLIGGVSFTGVTGGKDGQAFSFDGESGYVEVPSSPALQFSGPFSIEGWVNFDWINDSSDCIVAKGADDDGPVDWCLTVSTDGYLRPAVNAGGDWFYRDCQTLLQPGQWYHVAMVYDGTTLKGYVNGVLDGSWELSGEVQTSDEPMKIGVYGPDFGIAFFPGRVDELSLYDGALSATDVLTIYNAGNAGKCTTP